MSYNKHLYFFKKKNKLIFIYLKWEYIRYNNIFNIAKNVKGKSANKLTTLKLITYNGKMPTINMINSKSPKYMWFRICNVYAQIIYWICIWLKLIFQSEPNKHCNKTWNQMPHKTTKNTTPNSDNENTKKRKMKTLITTYLNWKKKWEKKMQRGDSK